MDIFSEINVNINKKLMEILVKYGLVHRIGNTFPLYAILVFDKGKPFEA